MLVACEDPGLALHRLAQNVEGFNGKAHKPFAISISTGAAGFDPEEPKGLEVLMQQADSAMYEQKRARAAAR